MNNIEHIEKLDQNTNHINLEIDDHINNDYIWNIDENNNIDEENNNIIDDINSINDDINDDINSINDVDEEYNFNFNQIVHIDDDLEIKEIQINDNDMIPDFIKKIKKDLKEDHKMFENIINEQNNIRLSVLKRVISTSYVNHFISDNHKIHNSIVSLINDMAELMDLESMIAALIADIIFDENILISHQIKRHKYLLIPFLVSTLAQENFLTQILIILQKHQTLIEQDTIIEIFTEILNNKLVSNFTIINWYNCLENYYNIDHNLKNAVHHFLSDIIHNLI
jgi:hypothetical protein